MHILITGGAGFIGSHIAEHHLGLGDKVHVIDDLSTGSRDNIAAFQGGENFRFDHADVLTWGGLEKAVAWADRIYHMAAVVGVFRVLADPIATLAINIAGCERLLRASHAGGWDQQIVLASSSEVYGSGLHPKRALGHPAESGGPAGAGGNGGRTTVDLDFSEDLELIIESSMNIRWSYAISKLADEAFGIAYARHYNMQITVVRLFNTIGPRQTGRYGMVVPRFIYQAIRGEPITVFGDGTQMRSFCDVRDTVVMLDRLAANPESRGQAVNVGNSLDISIGRLAEKIRGLSGSSSPIVHIPYRDAYGRDFEDIHRRHPSLDRVFQLTRYTPKWQLDDTLSDLISRAGQALPKEA